jgi:hypothetical protein
MVTTLVKGNAAVGTGIAVAIANAHSKYNEGRQNRKTSVFSGLSSTKSIVKETGSNKTIFLRVVVMSGAVIDLIAKPAKETRIPATSNLGS